MWVRARHLEVHRLNGSLSCFGVAGSVPVPSCLKCFPGSTWVFRWLSAQLRSPQRFWGWWVCSYLPYIALFLFVDWHHREWEHAMYTIFIHSTKDWKDWVQSSKYTDISYTRKKLQPTWNSGSYEHNITRSSAYKAPWIHSGIPFKMLFMKIMRYTVSKDPFPSLVFLLLYLSFPILKVFQVRHESCFD